MQWIRSARLPQAILSGLIAFSVLWKGGKSLETTWLLGGVAVLLWLLEWWSDRSGEADEAITAPLWITAVLFLGWSIVSYLTSAAANYGLDEIIRDASLILIFFWLTRQLYRTDGRSGRVNSVIRLLIEVIVSATVIAAAVGIFVYVLQPVSRLTGTFFDYRFQTDYWPNAWAEYVLLAWPLVCWKLCRLHSDPKAMAGGFLPLGLVTGSLLLSYSRGALLCFIAQLIFIAVCTWWLHRRSLPYGRAIIAALLTVLTAIAVFSLANYVRSRTYPIESVAAKATFSSDEGSSSVSERKSFWLQAMTLTAQRPLLGWGPYSFRFTQPSLQTAVLATSDHPHNVLLKLAAERGIPAAVLFAILLILIALPAVRTIIDLRRPEPDMPRKDQALLVFALAGICGTLAHNLIDYNLQFVGIALPLFCVLAIVAHLSGSQAIGTSWRTPGPAVRRTVEGILALGLLIVLMTEGRTLLLSSLGRHAESTGDSATALSWYEQAAGERFSRDMGLSRAALSMQQAEASANDAALLAKARASVDSYHQENPQDYRAWILEGDIDVDAGTYEAAAAAYRTAYSLGAKYNDPAALHGWLLMAVKLGHQEDIDRLRSETDELINDFSYAIERNTHFAALSTDVEQLSAVLKLLAAVYPETGQAYRALDEHILAKAKSEREKVRARPAGQLW